MKHFACISSCLLVVTAPTDAKAFELATHAALTSRAFQRSTIASDGNQLVRTLGVDTNIWNPDRPLTSVANVFGYPLQMIRAPDGIWRIDGM